MSVDELINALPDTRDKNNYIKQTADNILTQSYFHQRPLRH